MKTYRGHLNQKFYIPSTFFLDKYVVSGSEDHSIYIWNLQTQKVEQILPDHKDTVLSICSSETLKMLASGSMENDCSIIVYELDL